MTRDLAPTADLGVLLNLNKGPDFGLVPDFASIDVDELG
jgi:hypothetical protein